MLGVTSEGRSAHSAQEELPGLPVLDGARDLVFRLFICACSEATNHKLGRASTADLVEHSAQSERERESNLLSKVLDSTRQPTPRFDSRTRPLFPLAHNPILVCTIRIIK